MHFMLFNKIANMMDQSHLNTCMRPSSTSHA